MKTTVILLFSLAAVFTLALFYNIKADKVASPDDQMFTTFIDDESYRNAFMDAIRAKYPELILESAFAMTKDNTRMQSEMMNQLAVMCFSDPHMSQMTMGLTMTMCDIDKERCSMMSKMMLNHHPT